MDANIPPKPPGTCHGVHMDQDNITVTVFYRHLSDAEVCRRRDLVTRANTAEDAEAAGMLAEAAAIGLIECHGIASPADLATADLRTLATMAVEAQRNVPGNVCGQWRPRSVNQ